MDLRHGISGAVDLCHGMSGAVDLSQGMPISGENCQSAEPKWRQLPFKKVGIDQKVSVFLPLPPNLSPKHGGVHVSDTGAQQGLQGGWCLVNVSLLSRCTTNCASLAVRAACQMSGHYRARACSQVFCSRVSRSQRTAPPDNVSSARRSLRYGSWKNNSSEWKWRTYWPTPHAPVRIGFSTSYSFSSCRIVCAACSYTFMPDCLCCLYPHLHVGLSVLLVVC